jgi:hypothetical protein
LRDAVAHVHRLLTGIVGAVNNPDMTFRIVSGGQTGADRAALDAALAAGVPCGGCCPKGRRAEDGPIPPRYPLTELSSAGYPQRTRRNVADSDGTLIVSFGPPDRGTALTLGYCQAERKPTLVIDAGTTTVETAVEQLAAFVPRHGIKTLNVAGPRASKQPKVYAYVLRLLEEYLASRVHVAGACAGGPSTAVGAKSRQKERSTPRKRGR